MNENLLDNEKNSDAMSKVNYNINYGKLLDVR